MSLEVRISDTFSGPLDLLLDLIRREEMDIRDINVAKLASRYLDELRSLELVDMDEAAEFLSLASRLLEIKSRLLAPPDEAPEDDEDAEEEGFDPRAGLVAALLEYRRFKDAAKRLADMAEEQAKRYPRFPPPPAGREDAAGRTGSDALIAAFQAILKRLEARPRGREIAIIHQEIPIASRIGQIAAVLSRVGRTRFSLLLSDETTRLEMIGFFIAMLEMIRLGLLTARQAEDFSDIILEAREKPAGPDRAPPGRRFFLRPLFAPLRRRRPPLRRRGAPIPPLAAPRRRKGGAGRRPLRRPPAAPWRRIAGRARGGGE
ncbi:MAG: segregation/condensation protein A [Planctomycetota bacterium]|jgi:segregation and condensation protein A|nr:segregation/condensation protein A [Planctomycetota bacterium]